MYILQSANVAPCDASANKLVKKIDPLCPFEKNLQER
jgi:hypothetical protein